MKTKEKYKEKLGNKELSQLEENNPVAFYNRLLYVVSTAKPGQKSSEEKKLDVLVRTFESLLNEYTVVTRSMGREEVLAYLSKATEFSRELERFEKYWIGRNEMSLPSIKHLGSVLLNLEKRCQTIVPSVVTLKEQEAYEHVEQFERASRRSRGWFGNIGGKIVDMFSLLNEEEKGWFITNYARMTTDEKEKFKRVLRELLIREGLKGKYLVVRTIKALSGEKHKISDFSFVCEGLQKLEQTSIEKV